MSVSLVLALNISALMSAAPATADLPRPPAARRVSKVGVLHGEKRQDDYFWLRRKDDPQVRAHLEAENAYADSVMKPTEPLQGELYSEMLGRIKETDLSVPLPEGGFLLLLPDRKGKAVPDLLPPEGVPGGTRDGPPRRQRARPG